MNWLTVIEWLQKNWPWLALCVVMFVLGRITG